MSAFPKVCRNMAPGVCHKPSIRFHRLGSFVSVSMVNNNYGVQVGRRGEERKEGKEGRKGRKEQLSVCNQQQLNSILSPYHIKSFRQPTAVATTHTHTHPS